MDSTTQNQNDGPVKLVVCRPVTEGMPYVPSQKVKCCRCGQEVWVALTSPQVEAICMDCFLNRNPNEPIRVMGPTPEQAEEIEEYEREHPLPQTIERLCSSLRELRRTAPESFFGHPVEALYDRLEAALASFYAARVESTSPPPSDDPSAN